MKNYEQVINAISFVPGRSTKKVKLRVRLASFLFGKQVQLVLHYLEALNTPCLKLGIAPKNPHLPALELKLQGPKLRHPESFVHIY